MGDKNNPLLCDPIEGICGVPGSSVNKEIPVQKIDKRVRLVYFTDLICSTCWGIKPQIRKLKLEYGTV